MKQIVFSLLSVLTMAGCISNRAVMDDLHSATLIDSSYLESPFQVVYTESAFRAESKTELRQFELIERDEKIILKNGFIIVSYFNGEFIEFEGDRVVDFNQVLDSIAFRKNRKYTARPAVELLFGDDLITGEFYLKQNFTVYHAPPLHFPLIDPAKNKFYFKRDSTFRLHWLHMRDITERDRPENYSVLVKNIYDEEIATFQSYRNFIDLDLSKYRTNIINKFYLITVRGENKSGREFNSYEIAFEEIDESLPPTDFVYQTDEAVKALELAFERENARELYEAKMYYEYAARLSDRKVYTDLLQIFMDRMNL